MRLEIAHPRRAATRAGAALATAACLLLVACSGSGEATPAATTPAGTVAPVPVTPSATAPAEATTPPLSDQYEIREADRGRTFVYGITTRFAVILDGGTYADVTVSCMPEGAIGAVANLPEVEAPLVAHAYAGVRAGTCELTSDDFAVTVRIVDAAE